MVSARGRLVACVVGVMTALAAAPGRSQGFDDEGVGFRDEDVRILGRAGSDEAGSAIAVGDVSGDGVGDVVIGAPLAKGAEGRRPRAGQVAIVLGSAELPSQVRLENAAYTIFGGNASARLGTALAVGDIDADGAPDVIMGAPEGETGHGESGAVYVFYGGSRLTIAKTVDLSAQQADLVLFGTEQGGRLGRALAVGDFDGDGRDDFAAAGPGEGDAFGRREAGSVYIFFGVPALAKGVEVLARPTGRDGDFVMQVRGPVAHSGLGLALAAGDINGDAIDDLIVGAPVTLPDGSTVTGDVYVVFGSRSLNPGSVIDLQDPDQVDLRIKGNLPGDRFATAVGAANINGDAIADILIGAPESEYVSQVRTGRAYAIFGRPFAPGTTIDVHTEGADVTLAGPHDKAELGTAVTGGDLNADGIDDWVVGAPGADRTGQAYRLPGREVWSELGVVGALTQGARPGDRAGAAAAVGDVTGDGVGDLVMGAPLYDGVGVKDGVPGDHPDSGAVYVFAGEARSVPPSPSCADADGDGFRAQGRTCGPADCDDLNAGRHPFANEICGDGIDNDCDGYADVDGVDEDGDGWPGRDVRCGLTDCNDQNPNVNPGVQETGQTLCSDAVDNDCDTFIDLGDAGCQAARDACGNCIDDDGDGFGDLSDPDCVATIPTGIEISEASARRGKGKRAVVTRLVVRGAVSNVPDLTIAGTALQAGLAIRDGLQQCLQFAPGAKARGGVVQYTSTTKPRTTLRVKAKRNGRVEFRLEHRGAMTLPSSTDMTLAVGLFTASPVRGGVELRTNGRSITGGGSGQ